MMKLILMTFIYFDIKCVVTKKERVAYTENKAMIGAVEKALVEEENCDGVREGARNRA